MLNRWKKKKRKGEALLEHFQFSPRRKTKGDAVVRVWRSENPPSWNWLAFFAYLIMQRCVFLPPIFYGEGGESRSFIPLQIYRNGHKKKKRWGGDRRKFVGNPLRAPTGSWFEYLWKRNWNSLPGKNQSVYIRLQVFFFGLNRWKKKKIQLSTGERTGRVALTGVRFLEAAPAK